MPQATVNLTSVVPQILAQQADFQQRQAELQQQAAARQADLQQQAAAQQADFQKQLFALFGKAINPSNAFQADKE